MTTQHRSEIIPSITHELAMVNGCIIDQGTAMRQPQASAAPV